MPLDKRGSNAGLPLDKRGSNAVLPLDKWGSNAGLPLVNHLFINTWMLQCSTCLPLDGM